MSMIFIFYNRKATNNIPPLCIMHEIYVYSINYSYKNKFKKLKEQKMYFF